MIIRRCLTVAATLTLAVGATATPAGADTVEGSGGWVSNIPCTFTDFTPGSNEFACVGSNDWLGTLNAVTYFTGEGTYDPVSQAAKGTFDERAVLLAADGTHGTIHLIHNFTIGALTDGVKALQIESIAEVVGGTGGFKGATGKLKFTGVYSFLCCGGGLFASEASMSRTTTTPGSNWATGRMTGQLILPGDDGARRVIRL